MPDLPELDLNGRVAVVTGGGRSIGRATSLALAQAGAAVALLGRDRSALTAAATSITAEVATAKVTVLPCDVSNPDDVDTAMSACTRQFGGLDILVANAGVFQQWMPSEHLPRDEWDRVLSVDLTGVWACCRSAGTTMLEKGGGSIVTVSSVAGLVALANTVAYNAAKAGVIALTRALAAEWGGRGVRVNCVAPGFVERDDEPLKADTTRYNSICGRTPLGRFGTPREIALAILFLVSDAAGFVLGSTLTIDGGWTAV